MKLPSAEGMAGITNRKIMIAPCSVNARLYICCGVICVSVMLRADTILAVVSFMIVGPGCANSVRISRANERTQIQAGRDRHEEHDAHALVVERERPRREPAGVGQVVVPGGGRHLGRSPGLRCRCHE